MAVSVWIEKIAQARRLLEDPRLGAGAHIQAGVEYRQSATALERGLLAFDWVELIAGYLDEAMTAYDARRHQVRTRAQAEAMIDAALELLREVREINTKPLVSKCCVFLRKVVVFAAKEAKSFAIPEKYGIICRAALSNGRTLRYSRMAVVLTADAGVANS